MRLMFEDGQKLRKMKWNLTLKWEIEQNLCNEIKLKITTKVNKWKNKIKINA